MNYEVNLCQIKELSHKGDSYFAGFVVKTLPYVVNLLDMKNRMLLFHTDCRYRFVGQLLIRIQVLVTVLDCH